MTLLRHISLYFLYIAFICLGCNADMASETTYLTWQHDPTSTMTIQWLSPLNEEKDTITYKKNDDMEWKEAFGAHIALPRSSTMLVHRVEITHLDPNCLYQFKLPNGSGEFFFKTMPAFNSEEVRFVVGGDIYHDGIDLVKETNIQAAKQNPHFAVVGGDIAYAVKRKNDIDNMERWIEWIRTWNATMKAEGGRLIPIVAAIGNHDIPGLWGQTPMQAKVFLALFPRPSGSSFTVLDFGHYLSLFLLDSGHATPVKGLQSFWLDAALKNRNDSTNRIAVYHVPAYPSVRSFHNDRCECVRKYWVPIFEKHKLHFAFEHHDHAYKRTHPLLKNKVEKEGIVYFGDGAWGIEEPRKPRGNKKRPYIAKFASERHFILVSLKGKEQKVTSINAQGKVLDSYSN